MARKNALPWKQHTDHGQDQQQRAVPPVLPRIVLEAVSANTLIATVNGDKLTATPIARREVHKTLSELVARLGTPTRVAVRELDGTVHADILTPPRLPRTGPRPASPTRRGVGRRSSWISPEAGTCPARTSGSR